MKKLLSLALTVVLTVSVGMTVFAASSTTVYNSNTVISSKDVVNTMKAAKAGELVDDTNIYFSYVAENGMVDMISLAGLNYSKETIMQEILSVKNPTQEDANLMIANMQAAATTPVSNEFLLKAITLNVNNFQTEVCNYRSYKPSSVKGKVVTLNKVTNIFQDPEEMFPEELPELTQDNPIMLMGVTADGKIEFVEGIIGVDGKISGTFVNMPIIISVFALQ